MKKIIIAFVALAIVGIGTYYFVFNKSYNVTPTYITPVSNSLKTNTPENTAASSVTTVDIRNFSFNPSTLTVKTGTKVTWVNNDGASHTVTSDSDNLLNSETLSPGQSFSFIFTNPGSVKYHCSIHPMMKGTVIVEN